MFVHTCRAEDDGPGGRERPVTTQSVSEDHLGGGDRESRQYSEQVTIKGELQPGIYFPVFLCRLDDNSLQIQYTTCAFLYLSLSVVVCNQVSLKVKSRLKSRTSKSSEYSAMTLKIFGIT